MVGATLPSNDQDSLPLVAMARESTDYEECLACQ
jgi:hypothetical protein